MAEFVYTPEEAKALLARLSEPFAIRDVQWRVTKKRKTARRDALHRMPIPGPTPRG